MLSLQDDLPHEEDEESAREVGLLQIELESMKAIEQIHMLQQVSDLLLLLHAHSYACCCVFAQHPKLRCSLGYVHASKQRHHCLSIVQASPSCLPTSVITLQIPTDSFLTLWCNQQSKAPTQFVGPSSPNCPHPLLEPAM